MPTKLGLSTVASGGNTSSTPANHTASNTAFVLGTNLADLHVAAGKDVTFVEVCNVDTVAHQLVGALHQGAIVSPDDLFYQTIPAQSGWVKILAGDVMLSGLGLAFGAYQASELNKLNIRGYVNRTVDPRKLGLSAGGTYNKSIKIAGTAAGSATTLHAAITGTAQIDEVYLRLTNTSTATTLATLCVGGITTPCQVPVYIPGQGGWIDVAVGEALNNGLVVSAFAGTANVLTARGWVNRLS